MGYGRRSNAGITALVTCFYVLLFTWFLGKWWGILILGLLAAGCWAIAALWEKLASRRAGIRRQTEPCIHGVKGAAYNTDACSVCARERAQQQQAHLREQHEKRRAEESARQRAYAEWTAKIRLPEYVKAIDPQEFETLVCSLYRKMGYRVEETPYVGDNGADGYLYRGAEKTVLQCKRVQGSVGEPVLRDLYGTMHSEKCTNALVVTTGSVSKQARKWIEGKPIRIVELDELQGLLRQHFTEGEVVPEEFNPQGLATRQCPRCSKSLRVINGRNGRFIGCTGYPTCRYTSDVTKDGLPATRRSWMRRRR